jgi:hypothetical protein
MFLQITIDKKRLPFFESRFFINKINYLKTVFI